ncbi:hypothetical protein QQP08_010280 [Theobroma cacao]|nr:hypothetical protein QQP08_010280 [Theobroma cacao]
MVIDDSKLQTISSITTRTPPIGPKDFGSVIDVFRAPNYRLAVKTPVKVRKLTNWTPPLLGQMKFNVDSAARGCADTEARFSKGVFLIFAAPEWAKD